MLRFTGKENVKKALIFKKAYDRFFNIENERDLHYCKLNFADHSVVYDILRDLYLGKLEKPAVTFNKRAAEWFKQNGFTVVADGVNYTISL